MESRKRIFVVDDDIILLHLAEEWLKDCYEVSLAKSGRQMVRFLERGGKTDLILLDIDMPEMDGFETLLKLRSVQQEFEIPVIYLTGLSEPENEEHGFRLGAVDYIRKPVVREVLLARIAVRLAQSKNRHQLEIFTKSAGALGGLCPDKVLRMEQELTRTEFAVAKLVAQGYTNEEIGRMLNYSTAYIKKVVSRIFDRLDIAKRNEVKRFFI